MHLTQSLHVTRELSLKFSEDQHQDLLEIPKSRMFKSLFQNGDTCLQFTHIFCILSITPTLLMILKYKCYVEGIVHRLHFNNKNYNYKCNFCGSGDKTQGPGHSKQNCLPQILNHRPFYLILTQGWFNLCMQDQRCVPPSLSLTMLINASYY